LDGLKVDFLDYVRPSLDTPRGRECLKTIRTLVHEIRRIRPDALIEFRQRYTAPVMLPYATNFRANDVPFDYLENLHRCCQIRMVLGDGVPVHSDPICFHPEESCVNVARHLIAALAGVPMISADLTKIQPQHLAIIRRFLRFYLAHAETFRNGHWTIRYSFGHVASLSVETEREMIATAVSEIPPLSEGKNIILMSLATHAFPVKTGKSVDCEGNPSKDLPPGGMSSIEP
jgi:alpha-galactosidase